MKTQIIDDWTWEDKPPVPGWYAVLYCWEPQEGVFTDAAYWNGQVWSQSLPIGGYAGPFADEAEARAWAAARE